jgi:hypothetical protein
MKLGNKHSAAAPGGYSWDPGDVVEVPDAFGRELLLIQGGGFFEHLTAARQVVTVTPEPEVETPEADVDPHKLEANPTNDLSEAIDVASATTKRSKPSTK